MPLPPSFLSKHASARTTERFKISPARLTELMNAGLGKRIGVSEATHLIHRLLWSPEDGCLLVAIQDVVSGTVLTVLTLEMYKRDYAANLSETRIRNVINQMVHAGQVPEVMWQPGDKREQVTVHAHLSDASAVALGRWIGPVISADLGRLGERWQFWQWVVQKLAEKGYAVERLARVEARFAGGENREVPISPKCFES